MRKGDTVIIPGIGLMDGEFTFVVKRVNRLTRRFSWNAGILSTRGFPMSEVRWDPVGKRWVEKSLPLDVAA